MFSADSYLFSFLLSLIPPESRLGKVASLLAAVSRERSKTAVTGSSDWTGRGIGRGSVTGTSPSMKMITSRRHDKKSWIVDSSSRPGPGQGQGPRPVADAIGRDEQLPTVGLVTGDADAAACPEVNAVDNRSVTSRGVPSGAASSSTRREQRGRPATDPGTSSSSSLRPPFSTLSNNREREADVRSSTRIVKLKATAPPSAGPSTDCALIGDKVTDRSPNPFVKKTKKKKRVPSKVEPVDDSKAGHSSRGGGIGDPAPSVTLKPTSIPSAVAPVSRSDSGTEDPLRGCGESSMTEIEGEDQNEEEDDLEIENESGDSDGDRMDVSEERALEEEYRMLRARMEENACSEIKSRIMMMEEEAKAKGDPGDGALTALQRELRIATASATARAGANRGRGNNAQTSRNVRTGTGLDVGATEVKVKAMEPLAEVIATMSPKAILCLFQELDELEDDEEEEENDEGNDNEEEEDDEDEFDDEDNTEEVSRTGIVVSNSIEWTDQEYIGVDIDGSGAAEQRQCELR
jgi:hypothetical protein